MTKSYNELFLKIKQEYVDLFIEFIFDLGIEALEEKDDGIYVRSQEPLDDIIWSLEVLSSKINDNAIIDLKLSKKENKDWIDEYKKSIKPIQIDNIYIHTTWQKSKDGFLNIKIDPALAFGSGHHESTNSCIRLLQKYAKKNYLALDVGCGSGILSIILAKLGCNVQICDTDELAIESSKSNAKLNNVKFDDIWLGSIDKSQKKYDLIVANIIADVILILNKDLKDHLKDDGILILSGILNKYEEKIKDNFKELKLIDSIISNEWVSLVYKKEN